MASGLSRQPCCHVYSDHSNSLSVKGAYFCLLTPFPPLTSVRNISHLRTKAFLRYLKKLQLSDVTCILNFFSQHLCKTSQIYENRHAVYKASSVCTGPSLSPTASHFLCMSPRGTRRLHGLIVQASFPLECLHPRVCESDQTPTVSGAEWGVRARCAQNQWCSGYSSLKPVPHIL